MKNISVCFVKPLVASLLLTIQPALAADKELLDILLGNGAITRDQYEHLLQKDALSASDLAAESEPEPQLPIVKLVELERRLAENEMELDQILDRNVGVPVQGSWTDSFQLRGYVQNRHTTILGGDQGINLWSDRSVGDAKSLADADKNFLIRRARLVFFGDVGERLSFYIQPDLASSAGTTGNVAQLRDAYGDIYLTTDRVHRVRVGQSKVPFGFENLQSSQNRLALDRNDNHHVVARFSYPWKFSDGQLFEAGVQAYNGQYVPSFPFSNGNTSGVPTRRKPTRPLIMSTTGNWAWSGRLPVRWSWLQSGTA